MFKKILITLVVAALILPASVGATGIKDQSMLDSIAGASGVSDTASVESLTGSIIKAILSLSGLIFLILMVYAGMLWMTARGDEGKVDTSKEIIQAAIIGLAITVSAYAITLFVTSRFTSTPAPKDGGSGATIFCGIHQGTLYKCVEAPPGTSCSDVAVDQGFAGGQLYATNAECLAGNK